MRLYYFPEPKKHSPRFLYTYPISIGREGFATPLGRFAIKDKIVNPSWTATPDTIADYKLNNRPLRTYEAPGSPTNPLGKYAMLMNLPGYLLHGTNKPYSIGRRVSYGCIRLYPEDIEHLFNMIRRGTQVTIVNQPFKTGVGNGHVYLEAHQPLQEGQEDAGVSLTPLISKLIELESDKLSENEWQKIDSIAKHLNGMPTYLKPHTPNAAASTDGRLIKVGEVLKKSRKVNNKPRKN